MPKYTRLVRSGREWMLFVDGENLSKQGLKALQANGIEPYEGPFWKRDVFLWMPDLAATRPFFAWQPAYFQGLTGTVSGTPPPPSALRAYYYTTQVSDEPEWTNTRLCLRDLGFEPWLFKRIKGSAKAVDLSLATDLLTLGGEDRYDVAVLLAGDGDYLPLLAAVKRLGHHVIVGFFPDQGLNNELRIAADDFIDLTPHFVGQWRAHLEERAREALIEKNKAAAEGNT